MPMNNIFQRLLALVVLASNRWLLSRCGYPRSETDDDDDENYWRGRLVIHQFSLHISGLLLLLVML
jgi:hypothetical protein